MHDHVCPVSVHRSVVIGVVGNVGVSFGLLVLRLQLRSFLSLLATSGPQRSLLHIDLSKALLCFLRAVVGNQVLVGSGRIQSVAESVVGASSSG